VSTKTPFVMWLIIIWILVGFYGIIFVRFSVIEQHKSAVVTSNFFALETKIKTGQNSY
jgi:hypothetical protein